MPPTPDPAPWPKSCAWCERPLHPNDPAFAISITLRPEAFNEVKPGTVERLLLPRVEKQVPMILFPEGSPGKQAGKDALFQLCSEPCAKALQSALADELA